MSELFQLAQPEVTHQFWKSKPEKLNWRKLAGVSWFMREIFQVWTSLSLSLSSPPWSYVFHLICFKSLMWILIWILNLVQLSTLGTVWYCYLLFECSDKCKVFGTTRRNQLSVECVELTDCDDNFILFDDQVFYLMTRFGFHEQFDRYFTNLSSWTVEMWLWYSFTHNMYL